MRRRATQGTSTTIQLRVVTAALAFLLSGTLTNTQDLGGIPSVDKPLILPPEGRYLTLQQAQQVAAQPDALLARIAGLEVEAAVQRRHQARADYFPKIGAAFLNLHFNKFLGQEIVVQRPFREGVLSTAVPIFGQDQTLVAVTAAQPLTPLFKVREAVSYARADENIARAKAMLPVAQRAGDIEKGYFELLLAQREMALAAARVLQARAERATGVTTLVALRDEPSDTETGASTTLQAASEKVRELTASLNELLGWPSDTPLTLESPAPLSETLSLQTAVGTALATNPDIIEAEQTVVKAEAGRNLSKLDYVPDIAIVGGYTFQDDVIPALPRDFSFIGVMGSYNLFDFGKREALVKERRAQLEMARTALELTRQKVTAAVKTSYLKLEESRRASEVARGAVPGARLLDTTSPADSLNFRMTEIVRSIETLRLDMQHREAYAALRALMGR
jgi:outer membrane protein TolC